jgi:SWIM zinc finger
MFTKIDLKNIANSTSYQRGQSYFSSGDVRQLKRKGNTFTAKVRGTELYDVTLTLDKKENLEDYECDCPYDYDGACKHIVAVGLAAIEDYQKNGTVTANQNSLDTIEAVKLPSFQESFEKTSPNDKLLFLNQLLQKDIDLQQSFVQFVYATKTPQAVAIKTNVIASISTDVYEALSDLSFDEDSLYSEDYDDYYNEDGGLSEAEEMVEEVLQPYSNKIELYLNEGRLIDAISTWLGVYEGILAAKEPQADDYSIADDYPGFCNGLWNGLMKDSIQIMQKRPYVAATVRQVIDLLIERYEELEQSNNEDDPKYNLKDFEKLLILLVNDAENANYVRKRFEEQKLIDTATIYVMLHVAKLLNDIPYWITLAEDFAQFDVKIAQQILDYYLAENQLEAFKKAAKRLFVFHKNDIDLLIINTLTIADKELYLKALENYTTRKSSIEHYQLLRPHWTLEEREAYIQKQKGYGLSIYYAQLLEVEQKQEDLLLYFKNNNFWSDYGFDKLIEMVVKYFPEEVIKSVGVAAKKRLDSGDRGRSTYSSIASWLAAIKTNATVANMVLVLAKNLVQENPRLSAFKDELRTKGIKV